MVENLALYCQDMLKCFVGNLPFIWEYKHTLQHTGAPSGISHSE